MGELAEKAIKKLKEVHKPEIDKRLKNALEAERKRFPEKHEVFDQEIDTLLDFNLRGGKRLRPAFVVEGYLAVGGKNLDAIYDASIAIEGSEAYLLIHDDIIDDDSLRRGKPTVHVMYMNFLKTIGVPEEKLKHMGQALALVTGDIQAILDYDWLMRADLPDGRKVKALLKFNDVLRLTNYGQLLDIMLELRPVEEVKESDVLLVHSLKTSAYTIWGPLQIGAILGGGDQKVLDGFYNYGKPLGIAFQLQDDILGLYGDVKKTGKPAHSDLKEGKRTLLIIKALENADENQKKDLLRVLGKKDLTDEEAEIAREIVKETGSLDYNKELARELAEKGLSAIEDLDIEEEPKEYLLGIAEFLINREV